MSPAYVPRALLTSLQKITEKCYVKCVTKPGSSLSGSDEVRLPSPTP